MAGQLEHAVDPPALEDWRVREVSPLAARERVVELGVSAAFLATAAALLLSAMPAGGFDWAGALITTFALAAVSRIEFEVGSNYMIPTELVLVPMLFVVPPAALPLCVAVALVLAKVPEALLGRRPWGKVLMRVADSWFAVGPALVFLAASPGRPDGHDWPIYLAALGAQFALDVVASTAREVLSSGRAADLLGEIRWILLVDTLLAPAGLGIAFAAVDRAWAVLLVLPSAALIAMFARERRAHFDRVLELSRTYRGTALVLGNVVEADDAYTGMHSEGVVALALDVADELRLGARERRNVEFGALLHDVGKIAVPKEIINKAGPLDDDEWAIIRRHTIEGQKLLDKVGGFMRDVGLIVRASHERFDGAGYPDGLAGDAIPLEARVISCCDAFSAMTTDRSYRAARPPSAALEELRRCSGTQFDPRVVEAVTAVVARRMESELGTAALLPDPLVAVERAAARGV
jgi:HD-GYP domain-containing protein (c-di-GMP phosphodiesterase class II)